MDLVRTVYQQRWPAYLALVLGLVAAAVGLHAHGEGGSDIRYVGLLLLCTAYARISHQVTAARLRVAYRSGRTGGRVLVSFPRREEVHR